MLQHDVRSQICVTWRRERVATGTDVRSSLVKACSESFADSQSLCSAQTTAKISTRDVLVRGVRVRLPKGVLKHWKKGPVEGC